MVDIENFKAFLNLRSEQVDSFYKIIDSFEKGKKFFILEAGTGIGKSGTAITLANYYSDIIHSDLSYNAGTYITVHQRILQNQYLNEKWFQINNFNNEIDCIKSSENYICNKLKALDVSCGEVSKMRKNDKSICSYNDCRYVVDRNKFVEGKIGITNIQYFLHCSGYTKMLPKKKLLILDEAHNIENSLLQFVSSDISEWIVNTKFKLQMPTFKKNEDIVEWIKNEYIAAIIQIKNSLNVSINSIIEKDYKTDEESSKLKKDIDEYEFVDKYLSKINKTIETWDPEKWIIDKNINKTGLRTFSFKPIMIDKYADELLFQKANNVLLMSATILNKESFCKSIGIKPEDADFACFPSPFDIKKRPVYYLPVGKMSMENIKTSLPLLAKAVSLILQRHPTSKGIIHTHTFEIANYLKENVIKEQSKRLLTHTSQNRDLILDMHIKTEKATILLSPSMTDGVDLSNELSRFQIVCKVPFPYLGDKRISQKRRLQPWWYAYSTAKIIIQSLGRSIRSENDHAVSYILDENWLYFFKKNEKLFPKWFTDSLID